MRGSVRSSRVSCLIGAVAALWLCGAGSAWAGGGGGADAGTVQAFLDAICGVLGVTSCPQLPTATQAVLESSALENSPPDLIRGENSLCTVSGTLLFGFPRCDTLAITAANPPSRSDPRPLASSPISLASLSNPMTLPAAPIAVSSLSSLTPLAFMSPPSGPATPVPPGTTGANSFFYAEATRASAQPDTLTLFFDYPPLTNPTFAKGQIIAKISLPLQVLNADGSERLVCGPHGCPGSGNPPVTGSVATLRITANCNGGPGCLTANVVGDFSVPGTIETRTAADLGVEFRLVFNSSPNATSSHAIFEVQVPLLVTGPSNPANCGNAINSGTADPADCGNDPAYFGVVPIFATLANGNLNSNVGCPVGMPPGVGCPTGINQISGLPTAFKTNDLGFTPGFLGKPVGISPSAAPTCIGGGVCAGQVTPSTYPFCASFWANGASPPLHSAVAAFLAIGTDGTTYVSSPIPVPVAGLACPF